MFYTVILHKEQLLLFSIQALAYELRQVCGTSAIQEDDSLSAGSSIKGTTGTGTSSA
jgi:hypothetical protein